MSTAKVFSHKHVIGVTIDVENGTFLNDPTQAGQLGCVIPIAEIVITPEAKELLRNAKREGGSFAPNMIMNDSIGFLGFSHCAFDTTEPVISRDCILATLDLLKTEAIEVPTDFIEYVEGE